jgi:hypothetical protein
MPGAGGEELPLDWHLNTKAVRNSGRSDEALRNLFSPWIGTLYLPV